MAKPVIWTVDDDPDVLRAVERDLRRHYGDRYKVISADSGVSALEATKQLKLRNEPVALFLVDQRMPRMSGVEFLEQAMELYPEAKRALLTAYADTDAAIRAINNVHIDHYLMKPWDPPEERLYGVVDDMLDDWQTFYHPAFQGVRVVGHQWSPHSSAIRDFLGRNFVPHQWLNVETDEEAKQLLNITGAEASSLPIVVFADGSFLSNPPSSEVAHKLGLKTKAEFPFYDLVVVGAGPAGLAAAVYGAADGLHTLLIEREAPGGQAGRSSRIENYLGFPVGLSGNDLARRAVAQARRFGVEILTPQEVRSVRLEGPIVANCASVVNVKGFMRLPRIVASMFFAAISPSRKPCCAVGGWLFPVLASGTAAQSPAAHTPGKSGTARNSFTARRPRSLRQGKAAIAGLGFTPAVQIRVAAGMAVPSASVTRKPSYPATRAPFRTSTLRSSNLRSA